MIIAIDFDQTIAHTCYPEPPNYIIDGAKDAIKQLNDAGHTLILWTCRSAEYETEAWEFCKANGLHFHYMNANTTENLELYGRDNRKVYADVYIDDKNIGGLPSWGKIVEMIKEMNR